MCVCSVLSDARLTHFKQPPSAPPLLQWREDGQRGSGAALTRHVWSDHSLAVTGVHFSGSSEGGVRGRVATCSLDHSCKVTVLLCLYHHYQLSLSLLWHQLHLHSVQRQQCMQRGDYSCNCCLTIWLRYLFWGNKLDCLKVSFPHSLSRASKAVVQYKSVYTCTPVSYLPYTCNCQGETWEMNYHRKLYCTITHRIHSLPGQYSDHVLLLLTDSTAVQQLLSECWQR